MNFDLSEDQTLFKAAAERFASAVDIEERRQMRQRDHGYDRTRWRTAAELGLLALTADENAGGLGGSLTDCAVVAETLGQAIAIDPWLENGFLPARLLAQGATEETARLFDGSLIAALAFAEPNGRYALAPRAATACAANGGFVLSGEKRFVMGGAIADLLIVTADLDGTRALFLVPAEAEGLHRRAYRLADGSEAAEIHFHDVALPAGAKLAIDDEGFETIVAETRMIASAEMTGLAQRLLDDTIAYVKEREQFGVPIGSFQAIQHRLVDCYAAIEQMRSMLWRTVLGSRQDEAQWRGAVSGAKAFIATRADRIACEAVQFHGGMGVTDELAIGHAMKRITVLARLFGDPAAELASYVEAA
jgi:alkylation response protein AidB-like acyl-CoA dehydrogenase